MSKALFVHELKSSYKRNSPAYAGLHFLEIECGLKSAALLRHHRAPEFTASPDHESTDGQAFARRYGGGYATNIMNRLIFILQWTLALGPVHLGVARVVPGDLRQGEFPVPIGAWTTVGRHAPDVTGSIRTLEQPHGPNARAVLATSRVDQIPIGSDLDEGGLNTPQARCLPELVRNTSFQWRHLLVTVDLDGTAAEDNQTDEEQAHTETLHVFPALHR